MKVARLGILCVMSILCMSSWGARLWAGTGDIPQEQNWHFSIGADGTYCDYDGNIVVSSTKYGLKGTRIDLKEDIDIEEEYTVRPYAELSYKDRHIVYFGYQPLKLKGSQRIEKDIQFRDTLFRINTVVKGTVDIDMYTVQYSYGIVVRDACKWYISCGVNGYTVDARLTEVAGMKDPLSETKEVTGFLPCIGTRMVVRITSCVGVECGVNGMFEYDNKSMIEGHAALQYYMNDYVTLQAGFLYRKVTIEKDSSEGELTVREPFVGLKMTF